MVPVQQRMHRSDVDIQIQNSSHGSEGANSPAQAMDSVDVSDNPFSLGNSSAVESSSSQQQ